MALTFCESFIILKPNHLGIEAFQKFSSKNSLGYTGPVKKYFSLIHTIAKSLGTNAFFKGHRIKACSNKLSNRSSSSSKRLLVNWI